MTRTEILILAREIAKQVATELRSGRPSSAGIGALVQGDDQCDETELRKSMDPTSTATGGASSSPDQIAARLLSRSRQEARPKPLPLPRARKLRAAR